MATGWQTVHRVLRLPGARARAYLVQDHEPEFFGTSAERTWSEQTYGLGLHCICASPWLAALMRERYGASATAFDLGVDHDAYKPWSVHRRDDLVLLYARAVTPRRAVPLGLLALEELHRRRPGVELMLFGDSTPVAAPFPHRHLGVLDREGLAHAYNSATVGVVLSTTNPSLVPTEMLACGLPVVDLASDAMVADVRRRRPDHARAVRSVEDRRRDRAPARRPAAARAAHARRPRARGRPHVGARRPAGRGRAARRARGLTDRAAVAHAERRRGGRMCARPVQHCSDQPAVRVS